MTEDQVQRALIKHIDASRRRGLVRILVNNNPRSARDGARLKAMGLQKGAPDLVYVCRGTTFGHELKTEIGRLSPAQDEFLKEFNLAGGVPIVSYGLDHAIKLLSEYGIL